MDDCVLKLLRKAESQAISDKKHVGCVIKGWNYEKEEEKYFTGSNFHISDSFADEHAEQFAIKKALLERYFPIELYVSSARDKDPVYLCGLCREFVSSINNNITVYVINTDTGIIIGQTHLNKVFPNSKNFASKNKKWIEFCGAKY